jgi:hypothetical protein
MIQLFKRRIHRLGYFFWSVPRDILRDGVAE